MRIEKVNVTPSAGVEIQALMGKAEYHHLQGTMNDLCVFATMKLEVPSSSIKTGARHHRAKYLLFPSLLRRRWSADSYDFDDMDCGCVKFKEDLYVVFKARSKSTRYRQTRLVRPE